MHEKTDPVFRRAHYFWPSALFFLAGVPMENQTIFRAITTQPLCPEQAPPPGAGSRACHRAMTEKRRK